MEKALFAARAAGRMPAGPAAHSTPLARWTEPPMSCIASRDCSRGARHGSKIVWRRRRRRRRRRLRRRRRRQVSPKTIRDIWNRRTWAHATGHLPDLGSADFEVEPPRSEGMDEYSYVFIPAVSRTSAAPISRSGSRITVTDTP